MLRTTTTPYIYGIPGRELHADGVHNYLTEDAEHRPRIASIVTLHGCDTESSIGREAHSAGEAPHGPRPLWGWDNNNKTLLLIPRTDIHTAGSLDSALGPFVHRWGLGRMRNSPTCQFCQTAAAGSMGT